MDTLATSPMRCSIIVPTHDDQGELEPCLLALRAELAATSELIVVIDGPPAEPAITVARAAGARVLALERRGGPAAARNHGATHAQGELLVFVDADVLIRAGGLGAVRRVDFWKVGGFDAAAFTRPSVEDIELGYRLRAAGGRILLDRELQGTHLKRWTLSSMIRTDVSSRAVPWARLVLRKDRVPSELNLRTSQRMSASLTILALVGAVLAFWRPVFLMLVAVALLTVACINRRFYRLLWRRGGIRLASVGFALHLLYFLYSAGSFALVWLGTRSRVGRAPR